jgi:Ni,Fe-hydrogenase III large subunit/Ni,Fe-hydrogenase III component G
MTITVRTLPAQRLPEAAKDLHVNGWRLGTMIATERAQAPSLRYCFYQSCGPEWLHILVSVDPQLRVVPSLTPALISADFQEREIEDLFSISFTGHPRLGNFVLHDDKWAEGIGPMRSRIDDEPLERSDRPWNPLRVLRERGAFAMPVGPIFSGTAESALFLLESVGEDVVRAVPRLFYKYRAIEKIAEGRSPEDALLLAERCSGTTAFGNAWGFCRAVEAAAGIEVPPRANGLRVFLAELERVRHHVGNIRDVCESTALNVAASQAAVLEEQLLRASARLCGHRYLFGALAIGGLARDFDLETAREALFAVDEVCDELRKLRRGLEATGSFLDRIEGVGTISADAAHAFELLGPMARASATEVDMRRFQPYASYESLAFEVPTEAEGDGFARLRILFREIEQSRAMIRQTLEALPRGAVRADGPVRPGAALGWVEAPRGASLHWVEIDEEARVARYRLTPASFRNWHGFHIATEDFAFQDFPIILATLGLSVAENDR